MRFKGFGGRIHVNPQSMLNNGFFQLFSMVPGCHFLLTLGTQVGFRVRVQSPSVTGPCRIPTLP